jgi:hypothetical protein
LAGGRIPDGAGAAGVRITAGHVGAGRRGSVRTVAVDAELAQHIEDIGDVDRAVEIDVSGAGEQQGAAEAGIVIPPGTCSTRARSAVLLVVANPVGVVGLSNSL